MLLTFPSSPSPTVAPAIAVPPHPPHPADAYAALDDPVQQAAFTRPADRGDLLESWLRIDGMTCAACAQTIEQRVAGMPGVQGVSVSAMAGRARILWHPARLSISQVFATIAALRYAPYPVQDVGRELARREERRMGLWRLFVAGFCMMQVMMYASPAYFSEPGEIDASLASLLGWASWMLSLPVVLFAAKPFFARAWADLRARRIGMDVPVALGIAVTFVASSAALFDGNTGELYFDSLAMFVFFLLGGRYLETLARGRAAQSLEDLASSLPDRVERFAAYPARTTQRVALHQLTVGDVVAVAAGQAFPADGVLLEGDTEVDEALVTGEGRLLPRRTGDEVVAGSHNLHAPVVMRVERLGQASRLGQIIALMEQAALERPPVAALADRYARVFLIGVLVLAALAGFVWWHIEPARAVWIAVSVLVVTCPCALSLAAPAAFLAATGHLARRGVLVCRSAALERLAGVTRVVFDKTGTLSDTFALTDIDILRSDHERRDRAWTLSVAAALEAGSLHPLARALVAHADTVEGRVPLVATGVVEKRGAGMQGCIDGRRYRIGAPAFAWPGFIAPAGCEQLALLADERGPIALFRFGERLRPDALEAVQTLRGQGVALSILSGDREEAVKHMAGVVQVHDAFGTQTPEDKLAVMRRLQQPRPGEEQPCVAMVGDGINDGPVLACADVSVVMGSGAPLSQSRADLVLLSNRLGDLAQAVSLSRRMKRVITQNLWWAAGYNAVCVPLALLGYLPPWLAGLGMAASSLLVVLNALRLTR